MVSRFVDPFREFFLVSLYHSLSIVHKFVTFADVKKRQVRMAPSGIVSSRIYAHPGGKLCPLTKATVGIHTFSTKTVR